MAVTPSGVMTSLLPSLAASSMLGSDVPKYAYGVALGVTIWVPQIQVTTVDVGTVGTGTNIPQPLTVPSPILYGNLVAAMSSRNLIGMYMPAFMLGLANGLSGAFAQMLIKTQHAGVGVGSGVARFMAPPAVTSVFQGFSMAGLAGLDSPRKAAALGQALDMTFASLVIPVTIVGAAYATPSVGVGAGKII